MHLDLTSNLRAFRDALQVKARNAPRVFKKAVIDATTEMFTVSRGLMSALIYNVAIPNVQRWKQRVRSGKRKGKWRKFKQARDVPAWKRTGRLLRGERFYFRGSGLDLEGIIDNDTPYAVPRHENRKRVARWRADALRIGGPRAVAKFKEAMDALGDSNS